MKIRYVTVKICTTLCSDESRHLTDSKFIILKLGNC